jgi:hypothetical protein
LERPVDADISHRQQIAKGVDHMKWLMAALTLALLASGAQAQQVPGQMNINAAQNIGQHASKANGIGGEEKGAKANDKAYNAALRNIPDKQYDPWHGVR